jgi:GWxTD domain-containing protein
MMQRILIVLALIAGTLLAQQTQLSWQDLSKNIDGWINGPVSLIATSQERDVWPKLKTPEDKMQFIRIFWARRDPILRTRENEFKEEFYKRVDYAEANYKDEKSEVLGWKTARGQVYVVFGPPSRVEPHSYPSSSRPALLWVYDKRPSDKIQPNEALLFVWREFKYVLLPPAPATGDFVGEQQRALEASTLPYQSIPSVVQEAFIDVSKKDIVDEKQDYRKLLSSVTSSEKFGMPGIEFEWSKLQDNPFQLQISIVKENAPVYDSGAKLFAEFSVKQELKKGDVMVASNEHIETLQWDQKSFADLKAITFSLPPMQAPSGDYDLVLTVQDRISQISETRKFPVHF